MSNLLLENRISFGSSSRRDCIWAQSFARDEGRGRKCATPSGHFLAGPRCVRDNRVQFRESETNLSRFIMLVEFTYFVKLHLEYFLDITNAG